MLANCIEERCTLSAGGKQIYLCHAFLSLNWLMNILYIFAALLLLLLLLFSLCALVLKEIVLDL